MFCQKKRVCKYLKDRNACFIKGTDQVIFVPKAGAKIEIVYLPSKHSHKKNALFFEHFSQPWRNAMAITPVKK